MKVLLTSNKSIINNISFSIKKGSVNAIIGKSGVGKTTILDLLLGFLFPKSGKITVDNAVLSKDNYKQLRNISGYVSQNVSFIDNSVINNIILGKSADNINIKSV